MAENGKLPASQLAPIAQGWLRKDAAAGFNAMNVESRKKGLELHPTGSMSSYRTFAQQQFLWGVHQRGGPLAAVPGSSNHGWGLAVDFATPQMRAMVDRIGVPYGWSKSWSDAPSEWWHVVFQPGHYKGPDPGPEGKPAGPRTLKQGDKGADVKQLQTYLLRGGYLHKADAHHKPAINGTFGPGTKHAVEAFQREHKLKPDGIAGPVTLKALRQRYKR